MKEKVILTKDELVLLLKKQLSSIESLCEIYDSGKTFIAQDIAVKLRVIFHHIGDSKSLLHQLKLRNLPILCSCQSYDPNNMIKSHLGLLVLQHSTNNGWSYAPSLKTERLTKVSFENWWNSKKIIVDTKGNIYTRARIIKSLANQDGGAHVDEGIDKDYYDLTRMDTSGWTIRDDHESVEYINPVPPTIRQIAFETLESFRYVDIYNESKLHG